MKEAAVFYSPPYPGTSCMYVSYNTCWQHLNFQSQPHRPLQCFIFTTNTLLMGISSPISPKMLNASSENSLGWKFHAKPSLLIPQHSSLLMTQWESTSGPSLISSVLKGNENWVLEETIAHPSSIKIWSFYTDDLRRVGLCKIEMSHLYWEMGGVW